MRHIHTVQKGQRRWDSEDKKGLHKRCLGDEVARFKIVIDFWDFSVQDLKSLLRFISTPVYFYCCVSCEEGLHYIQVRLNPTS